MQDFKKLNVWTKAHQLSLAIYGDTSCFPATEKFGLINQIRRSSCSIPTNIAEGCGRNGSGDFARFMEIAMGSASETEYLLLLSRDLGFLKEDRYQYCCTRIVEIKQMLYALITRVKPSKSKSQT